MFIGTMIAAFIFTLLGEAPFISMEKLLFNRSPKRHTDQESQQYDLSREKEKIMITNSAFESKQFSQNSTPIKTDGYDNYNEDKNPRERANNFKRRVIKNV